MKHILNTWLMVLLSTFISHTITAQDQEGFFSLNLAKVEPYKLEVTYHKTTHLLFPSPIRYVDLGSELLIADKAEDVENLLRVKASSRDFQEETNFSVVTQDGKFYSFDVFYSSYPDALTYDLLKLQKSKEKEYASDVLFKEMEGSSSAMAELIMETLYRNPKRTIRHIDDKSFGIQFLLRGLYVHQGKFYFVLHIKNSGNISYEVDFINFKITDRKKAKRTVMQDKIITPFRNYTSIMTVGGKQEVSDVFLLNQFTLLKDQVLEIELFEKNGGRHLKMKLDNKDLIGALVFKDMDVKLK